MLKFEFKGALRSLNLRPLQTFLSSLGVLIGVAAVVSMLAIGEGAKARSMAEIARFGLHNLLIQNPPKASKESEQLTLTDVEHLRSVFPFAEAVLPVKGGSAPHGRRFLPLITTTEGAAPLFDLTLSQGRFLSATDVVEKRAVCVLGAELADQLGQKGHVGADVNLGETPFRVIGILDKEASAPLIGSAEKSAWIPLGIGMGDALSEIVVKLKPGSDLALAKERIERLLQATRPDLEFPVTIPKEVVRQHQKMERTFNLVLAAVASVSLMVGGIGVANIMLATVSTRTREIGVRRALGATRRDIMRQFLAETLILTLGGALSGLILGVVIAAFVGHIGEWETAVTVWSCALALSISIGVGLLSGLFPAIKAARLAPTAALRAS